MGQTAHILKKMIQKSVELNYLLYLPPDYDENKKYPLILSLHGAGQRGDNVELVREDGIPKILDQGMDIPFIVLSPQIKPTSFWTPEKDSLMALLDEICANYAVDLNRIYLTGFSLGGYGVWELSTLFPERFAAVVPICGGGLPEKAHKIKDIPVWAVHGEKDENVSVQKSIEMVNALKSCGGNIRFTKYQDAGHNVWDRTYSSPEFYKWLLKHEKN